MNPDGRWLRDRPTRGRGPGRQRGQVVQRTRPIDLGTFNLDDGPGFSRQQSSPKISHLTIKKSSDNIHLILELMKTINTRMTNIKKYRSYLPADS